MYASARILVFGRDAMLLATRRWILEMSAFQVWSIMNFADMMDAIVAQQIDALVLCQTLSAEERWNALAIGRKLRPEMKILVMEDEFVQCPEDKTASVLDVLVHPRDFIAMVQQMTSRDDYVAARA